MKKILLLLCVCIFSTANLSAQTAPEEQDEIQDQEAEKKSQTIFLKIRGMVCGGCSVSISKMLKKTKGILKYEVSHEKGKATIMFDPNRIDTKTIIKIIGKVGYESSLIIAKPKTEKEKINE